MWIRSKSGSSPWVAVVVAYAIVLQAFFGGVVAGAQATARGLDQTLALSLCAPAGDAVPATDKNASTAHAAQSCCTAACPMTAASGAFDAPYVLLIHRPADFIAFARRLDRPVGFVSDYSQGNPRAPPALV